MSTVTDFPQVTDPVAGMLGTQVIEGINAVVEANKVLLAEESGTGVREIDKALKDYNGDDVEVSKFAEKMKKAQEAFKKAQTEARNAYRKNVLGEEEQQDSDIDTDAIKARRKLVMEAVGLLKSYAEQNSLPEVAKWAENLSIPQVGRQGSSNVGGRKPRAYVTVGDQTHNSFGEAAKAASTLLSKDDNKVEVTSNDLVTAWDAAGKDEFTFQGLKVKVAEKSKKSDTADAA